MIARPRHSDVEEFRSAVTASTGFRVEDDKLPLLAELLAARMLATGLKSVPAYLERARSTPSETAEFARALTVSETYFLRNRDQFRALETILREKVENSGPPLRLLSAGCSSGEEPYSLAIVLRESLGDVDARGHSILAFDLNPDALAKAQSGEYSSWSLRETPESVQAKYFRSRGRSYVLDESIRGMVRFEERNLVVPDPDLWRSGAFDVIFCRNVLMYFTPEIAKGVVARFASSLTPDGFLFLGHAENLRGLSRDFHLLHSHGTFFYQRRSRLDPHPTAALRGTTSEARALPAVPVEIADGGSWVATIARSADRIEELSRSYSVPNLGPAPSPPPKTTRTSLEPALHLLKQERYREALALVPGGDGSSGEDLDGLLLRAVLLTTSGDLSEAEVICKRILEIDELNAGAHYVLALCREHAGDREHAIEHDRIALYLDPDFAMPHLHLGLLARRAGDRVTARRELELAHGLLSREDGARIVLFGGGFGREALMKLCHAELRACGDGESR